VQPASTEPEIAAGSLRGVSVLVVDDDRDAQDVIRSMLMDQGATVTLASNAAQGYAALLRAIPDVLVCDIAMPGEDGFAFINRVRTDPDDRIATVPAVAVTAYAQDKDRQRAFRSGFHAHLAKPVSRTELISMVSRLSQLQDAKKAAHANATQGDRAVDG
jgi:CheY-like chemotaxis protein